MDEVKKHNKVKDGWLVVDKYVHKIPEKWITQDHPGGNIIKPHLGKDITELWNRIHFSKASKIY